MDPIWTFTIGLILLVLFGWYFATDIGRRKRIIGTVLTLGLVAFCLWLTLSSGLNLGMDLKGGTSFLIRLVKTGDKRLGSQMLEQAAEVIRKRIDSLGVSEPVIIPEGEDRILVQIAGLDKEKSEAAR